MVKLTVHIINVTFPYQNPYTGENWTIKYETFDKGWDKENNTVKPFPQGCMTHAEPEEETESMTMTMEEFVDILSNSTTSIDNATKCEYVNLTSGDSGDIIILRDQIRILSYNSSYNYTRMAFVSDLNNSHYLFIGGDLTKNFADGDNVEIKFHVMTDVFADPNNPSWTVSVKTIEEMWDTTIHRFTSIPPDIVKKV